MCGGRPSQPKVIQQEAPVVQRVTPPAPAPAAPPAPAPAPAPKPLENVKKETAVKSKTSQRERLGVRKGTSQLSIPMNTGLGSKGSGLNV
jgi:hypothetical protein